MTAEEENRIIDIESAIDELREAELAEEKRFDEFEKRLMAIEKALTAKTKKRNLQVKKLEKAIADKAELLAEITKTIDDKDKKDKLEDERGAERFRDVCNTALKSSPCNPLEQPIRKATTKVKRSKSR